MTDSAQGPFLDRRRVLGCAALFGISGPLLVACGSGDGSSSDAKAGGTSPSPGGSSGTPKSAGAGLIAAADVPVGGGVILTDQQIVVTQPTKGEFKGFSSVCPHQGNPVGSVGGGRINCPFHGSQFSIEDGSNLTGPNGSAAGSVAALPEIPVKVEGGQVVEA
jgi:nitrite reductase/ring-hydroxylating ferredoxin subunit